MSTDNSGTTTPSDLFVSLDVILVNQKQCITCLKGSYLSIQCVTIFIKNQIPFSREIESLIIAEM